MLSLRSTQQGPYPLGTFCPVGRFLQLLPQAQQEAFLGLEEKVWPPNVGLPSPKQSSANDRWECTYPGERAALRRFLCHAESSRGLGPSAHSRNLLFSSPPIPNPILAGFPSLPHFSSWDLLANKLLTLKSLSQCLFWGNPTQDSIKSNNIKPYLLVSSTVLLTSCVENLSFWTNLKTMSVCLSRFQPRIYYNTEEYLSWLKWPRVCAWVPLSVTSVWQH